MPGRDPLALFSFRLFSNLQGAVTSAMVHLGDRLGLYKALAGLGRPATSDEVAGTAGLDERWVREWLHNQGAAELVTVTTGRDGERFSLSDEATAVLADPHHPAFGMGMFGRVPVMFADLDDTAESFRTGVGYDYDHAGEAGALSLERSFEPWNRAHLVTEVLPAVDGVVERLVAGAKVADIGCGAGGAVMLMADAFPRSTFAGYDISQFALERAEQRRREAGADHVSFHDPRVDPLPTDRSVDFVTTFDCLHDMTDPAGMMGSIREALADDGVWLLVDIKALDSYEENVAKNPMSAMMYGISVLSCMASALSHDGGAGLGTLGLPESKAREMANAAGFRRFRRVDVDHPVNAFYEIRP